VSVVSIQEPALKSQQAIFVPHWLLQQMSPDTQQTPLQQSSSEQH
jgi:hypothetical protein